MQKKPDFNKDKDGLLPAIIQDYITKQVLMLGYMNEESYNQTCETNKVCFYSRSKKRLWVKGETSSNFLHVKEIHLDCDSDAILIKAKPDGPTCHTGSTSCFDTTEGNVAFLEYLQEFIDKRKKEMPEGSYTTKLFNKGINKIAQKVGEEAVELVIEAKDNNDDLFLNEAADLMYHFVVLLSAKDKTINQVVEVLRNRHS